MNLGPRTTPLRRGEGAIRLPQIGLKFIPVAETRHIARL